jgi:hypothetical protein
MASAIALYLADRLREAEDDARLLAASSNRSMLEARDYMLSSLGKAFMAIAFGLLVLCLAAAIYLTSRGN